MRALLAPKKNRYKNIDFCTFRLIQLWWFLVFTYFLLWTWARVIKAFSVEFNTGRVISAQFAQLPHCEKFHWATVARSGKYSLLGSFLFVIASPGIRHPGLPIIDSQSQNYEYSGAWCVVHMSAPCDRRGPISNQLTSGWFWEPISCTVLSLYEWSINWRNLLPGCC